MGGHSLCFGPGWEFLVLAVIIGRHSLDFLAGSALILSLSLTFSHFQSNCIFLCAGCNCEVVRSNAGGEGSPRWHIPFVSSSIRFIVYCKPYRFVLLTHHNNDTPTAQLHGLCNIIIHSKSQPHSLTTPIITHFILPQNAVAQASSYSFLQQLQNH